MDQRRSRMPTENDTIASESSRCAQITIYRTLVLTVIFSTIFILSFIAVALLFLSLRINNLQIEAFFKLFDLDKERNLPTFYQFVQLFACIILILLNYTISTVCTPRWRHHWLGLFVIFLLITFDETAQVHEKSIDVLRELFDASGLFFFAWIIPAIALVFIVGVLYLQFLRNLPRQCARLIVIAAFLYVGGAIGFEMISGAMVDGPFEQIALTFDYRILTIIEEILEMLGIAVFIWALLKNLKHTTLRSNVIFRLEVR